MSRLNDLKRIANATLRFAHLRVERAGWGPRGTKAALEQVRRAGARPQQIVDVGAATGTWARECAQVFPEAKIFMVEALRKRTTVLGSLAAENPKLTAFIGGLGRARTRLSIHTAADQSSFLPSADHAGRGQEDVEVYRLDDLVAEGRLDAPDLLKLDVQGFELEVLAGAEQILARCPLVLLEVSFRRLYTGAPLAHEVIAYMAQRGYRILDICSYVQRPHDDALAQADILFAKDVAPFFAHEAWQ